MYRRAIQLFKPCPICGRKIRLTRHGSFRRHIYPKGVVCDGSWQYPHKQEEALRRKPPNKTRT